MERKDFIVQCAGLCMAGLGITWLQSCKGNYYATNTFKDNSLVLAKSEFTEVKDGKQKQRKFVLLKSDKLNFPVCVYKLEQEKYSALLMECTHKSCELNTAGEFLICPCHGSEFDKLGAVQNPPAENNLKNFSVKQDEKNLYIQL